MCLEECVFFSTPVKIYHFFLLHKINPFIYFLIVFNIYLVLLLLLVMIMMNSMLLLVFFFPSSTPIKIKSSFFDHRTIICTIWRKRVHRFVKTIKLRLHLKRKSVRHNGWQLIQLRLGLPEFRFHFSYEQCFFIFTSIGCAISYTLLHICNKMDWVHILHSIFGSICVCGFSNRDFFRCFCIDHFILLSMLEFSFCFSWCVFKFTLFHFHFVAIPKHFYI